MISSTWLTAESKPLLPGFLRSGPIGVKTIRRGHRKKAHVAAILPDKAGCVDCAWGDGAGKGDCDMRVRTWPSQPVGALQDGAFQVSRHLSLRLIEGARGKPK